jgi:hypothetical protein
VAVVSLPPVGVADRRSHVGVRVRVTGRVRAVAAAASACVVLGGALVHLDARADLRAERAGLERARLERVTAADGATRAATAVRAAEQASAAAEGALADAVARVDRVRAALRRRTDERDGLRTELRAATEELTGVERRLVTGVTELGLQGAQITALDACLNGVSRALLQLAFEDDAGAAGSLRAVAGPCQTASVALER